MDGKIKIREKIKEREDGIDAGEMRGKKKEKKQFRHFPSRLIYGRSLKLIITEITSNQK